MVPSRPDCDNAGHRAISFRPHGQRRVNRELHFEPASPARGRSGPALSTGAASAGGFSGNFPLTFHNSAMAPVHIGR